MVLVKDEGIFIQIKGVYTIAQSLSKLANIADRELGIQMVKAVELVGNSAKGHAAVVTGFMKANIKGSLLRQRSVIIGQVKSSAPYSVYQEFGTEYQSGKAFMRPGLRDNEERIKELLGKAIMEAVQKVTRKHTSSTERLA